MSQESCTSLQQVKGAQAASTSTAQPVMKLLNFGSSQDVEDQKVQEKPADQHVAKMSEENFLQIFSEIHGEQMDAARFENAFQLSVN